MTKRTARDDSQQERTHGALVKHSVLIRGHRTSLSLEDAFWSELRRLAEQQGLSLNQLVSKVDETRAGNLSSALRLYVLASLKEERKAML